MITATIVPFLSSSVQNIAAEQVLTERDVAALMLLVHCFSDKWYVIGLGLGFTPSELNLIVGRPLLAIVGAAPTSYLIELLNQWVQWPTVNHRKKPTLKALCEVLRSSLVGLGSLADKVEREMGDSITGKVLLVADVLMH